VDDLIDSALADEVVKLVIDLAAKRYALLAADGRIGRVAPDDLAEAIADYGRTLVPLPEEALGRIEVYPYDADPSVVSVEVRLWTSEEGRSDLMLFLNATKVAGGYRLEIDDIRVP
jgi:hypothetical protein